MSFGYIRKILFLYCVVYILLLFFCLIHAWRLLSAAKKDGACMRIAIGMMALSPEAEDFLDSPENVCTLLRIPTLLKFSINR